MSIQDDQHLASRVLEIVRGATGKDVNGNELDLSSLGIDSMAKLDILARLEQSFHIVLAESLVREFVNVDRITQVVHDAIIASKKQITT